MAQSGLLIMEKVIQYLSKKHHAFKTIIDNYGLPIIQKRNQDFASLVHIILEQQVSIASAQACYNKLIDKFHQINPESILHASNDELKECGISRQKIIYIKDLAQKITSKELILETLPLMNEEEIRNELIKVKGIGNWTIEVYLMFCLQHPDIIPLGDIAIKNTIKEIFDVHNYDDMVKLSNNWKPYRTIASYILWHHYLKKRGKI